MTVPKMIDSTANSRVCVSPQQEPVEMHENRAELQGGLHGHPVTMHKNAGAKMRPRRSITI